MKWLKRILGPNHSIILCFDPKTPEEVDEIEKKLDHTASIYQPRSLKDLIQDRRGHFALCFAQARRCVFEHAVPMLRARELPFTVFVRPDYLGTNQLPLEDELAIYKAHHPEKFALFEPMSLPQRIWQSPEEIEPIRAQLRTEIGPLPLDQLSPFQFFASWGDLLRLPPELLTVGIHLDSESDQKDRLKKQLEFVRSRMDRKSQFLYVPKEIKTDAIALDQLGLLGSVAGTKTGVVNKSHPNHALPIWKI